MPIRLTLDTAVLMVRRNWFELVKGFDPELRRLEDTDFTWRLLYQGADLFYEDRVSAVEAEDSGANLFEFFYNYFKGMQQLPLLFKKHYMDYFFPSIPFQLGRKRLLNIWYWDLLLYLLEVIGVALSPHILHLSPRSFHRPVGQSKKMLMEKNDNPYLRSLWIGPREKIYDLNSWCMFKKTNRL